MIARRARIRENFPAALLQLGFSPARNAIVNTSEKIARAPLRTVCCRGCSCLIDRALRRGGPARSRTASARRPRRAIDRCPTNSAAALTTTCNSNPCRGRLYRPGMVHRRAGAAVLGHGPMLGPLLATGGAPLQRPGNSQVGLAAVHHSTEFHVKQEARARKSGRKRISRPSSTGIGCRQQRPFDRGRACAER